MSWLFTSGGQSIGASASASVLPMNIQSFFPLGRTGLISLQSKGLSSLLQHHGLKAPILRGSAMFCQNSSLRRIHLGWPCMAWHIASLSYRPFPHNKTVIHEGDNDTGYDKIKNTLFTSFFFFRLQWLICS